MQIITVAPIVRGALQGALTYFSKDPIAVGMVVVVPVRTREVPAIVLLSEDASGSKSALKSSDFAIRKITRTKPRRIWSPAFLKSAEETANFSAQKLGETLLALTPKTILDAHLEGMLDEPKIVETGGYFEVLAIQGSTEIRLEAYQRLVRESFVRHESVFVCVPTEDDVVHVSHVLGRGIENYTFALHSSTAKKLVLETWKNALADEHAILVVGTAKYIGLPRYFKTIVLDEEHSHAWKTFSRPHIDLRMFVENYARASGSTLIIGAPILRAETHERIARGNISEFDRIATRAREETKTVLIDPRREEKSIRENTGKRNMVLVSKDLRKLLEDASERGERVLLLSARKGLAPVTTCGDCGALVRCPECDTPLVIHKKETKNSDTQVFICHGCGFTRVPENNVHETCPNCGGWKLQGVGVGIDLIDNEIAALSPKTKRFILDGDRAKTRAQAKKIVAQFEKSESSILIATPMAIPLLTAVENTAIISIDSLFAIPDIRMSERIFALILLLREKTTGTLLIQTRADDTIIFKQALSGKLFQFAENELATRKAFSYPPYGTIIKITLRGKRAEVLSEMERLKVFLVNYAPIVLGTMAREPKNIFRMHMILKLAKNNWPNSDLLAKLRALPMQFTVEVNPNNLI
ncbi:MAG: hypothetical protein A2747_03745 [Candidatus Yonathbacteria bacterium RIFCSPHIGHO2_01_FULL_44_41]|uniref:Primosomal protein N n=1 Tax=Candidatus Yonathbacteria bacterium RIFCSPHIGHO2_02_FULL_44_14 TaxID=1802724 RepID=A0A1G2S7S2_9BACT|nr:MAG: hypothetical protein A2747_03745 [Candidatus Yonathbacteria bacterium RIFCSPHIGHO2_01_FULL_44_41]OHA81037.1 MAG: hypothetical protein A3D51_01635 [Candidatus Yonathbacteria bacterium RIFCSPHIGHO2_02_FULL_44_14]OHA81260.1 MAG: hypothetical protein A3B06_03345 [Candidatus Yonathbacteria bacterium RIFCSPLOWO2_01_FULL_43_20]